MSTLNNKSDFLPCHQLIEQFFRETGVPSTKTAGPLGENHQAFNVSCCCHAITTGCAWVTKELRMCREEILCHDCVSTDHPFSKTPTINRTFKLTLMHQMQASGPNTKRNTKSKEKFRETNYDSFRPPEVFDLQGLV